MIEKLTKKRSMYSLIDDRSFIYVHLIFIIHACWVEFQSKKLTRLSDSWRQNYGITQAKENWKINHRKMKRSIIYDWKSMIESKKWFLKTDQLIMIENQFLIGTTKINFGVILGKNCGEILKKYWKIFNWLWNNLRKNLRNSRKMYIRKVL